jgi:arylsulfatase A-like enzyme
MRAALSLVIVTCGVVACAGACSRSDGAAPASAPQSALSAGAPLSSDGPNEAALLDFVAGFDDCAMNHRGVLLDLGDPTMRARMSSPTRLKMPDIETGEHGGASWAVVRERSLELSFYSPVEIAPETGVVVEARVRGGSARRASVYLNGKPVGALTLASEKTNVSSVRATTASVLRGQNELLVRFVGGSRAARDPLAEIDWIRVGPSDGDAPYAAPTRADALATLSIGGIARRGVSLRAPGSVRCEGYVPAGAVLEGWVGVTGGQGEAEVRILRDRAEPQVAASFELGREDTPAWRPVSVPLGDLGTLAAIELGAKASSKGARIVFAEPRVVVRSPALPSTRPASRGVLLMVLGSAPRGMISPYGGAVPMNALADLASGGLIFEAHRASSGIASSALASMLTGLSAREHGILDGETALAPGVVTVAEAARQAGVVTAMFTGNPTTGAPFGFERGWETFAARSPAGDAPATAIVDEATRWIEAHDKERFLVVVHARGGHPPWDATSEELKTLPPAGYSGGLDPKHAGEYLGKAKRAGASRYFSDADRERAFALHAKALAAHDEALGRLVARLRALGRDADTTLIVTGDIGVNAAAHVPFLEEPSLDEPSLAVPLVVRRPGPPAALRVAGATSSVDLARTILEALDLPPPPRMRGASLWRVASRGVPERPSIAQSGVRFSARWGGFVLAGTRDREIKLCNLSLEPECVSDVRATHPLAAEVLHRLAFDELASGKRPAVTAPKAVIPPDAGVGAGLRVWGRP